METRSITLVYTLDQTTMHKETITGAKVGYSFSQDGILKIFADRKTLFMPLKWVVMVIQSDSEE